MFTLQDWIAAQGIGQKETASLLGVAQSTLSRVLNGQDPTAYFIRAAHRITDGKVLPNSFFPDLVAESAS